jgi:hypothetical protein
MPLGPSPTSCVATTAREPASITETVPARMLVTNTDAEIEAVLALIRSTWPERERRFQEEVTRASEAADTEAGRP